MPTAAFPMIDDDDHHPACDCVHRRHAPQRPRLRGAWVIGLQAAAVTAGLLYLAVFEVPTLVTHLASL
jgi:hypothetical protein